MEFTRQAVNFSIKVNKEEYDVFTGEVKMSLNAPRSIISQKSKLVECHFPYIEITVNAKIYCKNCARTYLHFAVKGVAKKVKRKTPVPVSSPK